MQANMTNQSFSENTSDSDFKELEMHELFPIDMQ